MIFQALKLTFSCSPPPVEQEQAAQIVTLLKQLYGGEILMETQSVMHVACTSNFTG